MTHKITRIFIYTLFAALFVTGCKKNDFSDYYARPDSLADPIYQQLQQRGNFTILLKVIDKAGYKETLGAAGLWTFFAPNDAAFASFLTEKGLKSVDDIPADLANSIVRYSLIYDAEKSTQLSSFFSNAGGGSAAFIPNQAFRRRTTYYDFVYDGKDASGLPIKVINANRNGSYLSTDFNNKHLPIYLDAFLLYNGYTAADYQYFYPNSTYSGFNAERAKVLPDQKDIVAENGVIHVIDKVITPPPSIDQYINSKPEYSVFKSMLDKFVSYAVNDDITHRYQVLSGKTDKVYAKIYSSVLAFSPNNENYVKIEVNDAQKHSYSAIIPNNQAVTDYAKKVLLKYYPAGTTLDQLYQFNGAIIRDFINAHLFTTELWPSKFKKNSNSGLGETPNINLATDIIEKQPLSNGFFYGTSKVSVPNIFSTIYASVYLNPKYSIMVKALDSYGYSAILKLPSLKYGLIPVSDNVLRAMGFDYDPFYSNAPFRYKGVADDIVMRRIIASQVIDFNDIAAPANYGGEGFLKTIGGEYIRYKSNRLISSGTLDSTVVATQSVKIDSTKLTDYSNGPALFAAGVMSYTANNVGTALEKYGTLTTDPYYKFVQYLKTGSDLYTASTKEVVGLTLGVDCTIFVPTNAAIDQAVRDGVLPGTFTSTTVTPNFNPTLIDDRTKVARFIQYHIVNKRVIAPDGITKGVFETLAKTSTGDAAVLTVVSNTSTDLVLRDQKTRTANAVNATGSLLGNRAVIHQIDNYLNYTY